MSLWHLATLGKNRVLIESAKAIKPLLAMLEAEGELVPACSPACSLAYSSASPTVTFSRASRTAADPPNAVSSACVQVPLLASMVLIRLANHGADLVNAVVTASGVVPLVTILSAGTAASKQMAAATVAAIASVPAHRDVIVESGAVPVLIALLTSHELGTSEPSELPPPSATECHRVPLLTTNSRS